MPYFLLRRTQAQDGQLSVLNVVTDSFDVVNACQCELYYIRNPPGFTFCPHLYQKQFHRVVK